MKNGISIIGVGKLGLCLALNLERAGFNIIAVDKDDNYISVLKNKTFKSSEPYVNDYLQSSNDIEFTTDLKKSLDNDIIFIVVNTPSTDEYKYDHTNIEKILELLIKFGKQDSRKDIVINCTTFPGYCDDLNDRIKQYGYYVSYNPEFIAQGTIIQDQLNCDNVLIGEADSFAGNLITNIYEKMVVSKPVYNRMSRTEAEITKLAVNCFLTTKISYANMIGDIATRYGCSPENILNAVGTDSRVGSKYLKYGFGFGGPCFPRDNRALAKCGEEVGIDALISKATDEMNSKHLDYQVQDFINKNVDKNIPIDIEYVTYKKESTSIEESYQLKFAKKVKDLGYKLNLKDNRDEVLIQIKDIL